MYTIYSGVKKCLKTCKIDCRFVAEIAILFSEKIPT